jgi:predicted TPR repeat methyltransferase
VECRSDHPEFRKNFGVALKNAGLIEDSIAEFRAAVALKPDYAEAHKNLGNALYQSARLDEAIAAYRSAIAVQPGFAEAHANLGAALKDSGQLEDAIAACRRATTLAPGSPEAYNHLGNALLAAGRHGEAIAAYRTALQLRPAFPTASCNLGVALRAAGQRDHAIAAFRETLRLEPNHAIATAHLGHVLREQRRLAESIAAYRDALRLKPDSPDLRHLLASLTGDGSSSIAPESFVRNMFDTYAAEFDEDLTRNLGYRVPELLLETITAVAPGRRFDVLDLGCGTGLCGAQFRSIADTLIGVDLSPAMLAKAGARAVYDQLITGDLTAVMHGYERSFDLLLAADVFIYIGDLSGTFAAAARALRPGGLFAFSVERHDGDSFLLNSRVRFEHSLAYIRTLAGTNALTEFNVREIVVRTSGASETRGWIVVLRR